MDVGQDTSLGDGDMTQELVELLVVADGELDVAGGDPVLLVVASGIAGQLEDLGSEVLEDGGQVHGGTGSDTGRIAASLEESANTTNGELKTSLGALGHRFLAGGLASATLASFSSFSGHV